MAREKGRPCLRLQFEMCYNLLPDTKNVTKNKYITGLN